MDKSYNPEKIEKKWQEKWEKSKLFKVEIDKNKEKYYLLEMFPYPSGRIHMGHVRNYTIGDVVARFKRMKGKNVLHPMGWDAFGLPAENAAIQNNSHPAQWTYSNIAYMKDQLKKLGFSYDWDREFATCDPEYYKWEQLIFIKMFEKGLAYRSTGNVNWCPDCSTVLANEQVEDGCCWRCGAEVEIKELNQWYFKITDYAEELLEWTYKLKGWPEKVLIMQRNWIGKSYGSEIIFKVKDKNIDIKVFTTRPDTLYGATFMSIAPEHPLVDQLVVENRDEVMKIVNEMKKEDKIKRTSDDYEKKGVFTGSYCINPVTGWEIPVYVANFVLMDYGTGAVMAVPAHDQRDFEFAKKYNLKIVPVIKPYDESIDIYNLTEAYEGPGTLINSDIFNGMDNEKAKDAITEYLAKKGLAKKTVNYRLKDWGISRQRYWGAPIPVIYCEKCGIVPEKEENLPVVLPRDVKFSSSSDVLKQIEDFVKTTCPKCGSPAKRETDTMDTFVESSWYFFRFADPKCDYAPFDKEKVEYWCPVDQYIGGIEHAVLHLLYARFYTKVLRDLGYCNIDEPFINLLTQGMVCKETVQCPEHGWLFPDEVENGKCKKCGKDVIIGRSEKMSKSKKNVIDPENIIKKYGADTARLFILFAAPPDKNLDWSEQGVDGCYRFLNRIWNLCYKIFPYIKDVEKYDYNKDGEVDGELKNLRRKLHETIKKVNEDIERRFHFNTAIAAIMEFLNYINQVNIDENSEISKKVFREVFENLIIILSPFTPHFAEELWAQLTGKEDDFLLNKEFPKWDESALKVEETLVVVQINGKLRGKFTVPLNTTENKMKDIVLNDEKMKKYFDGKEIKKVIFVKNKLINFVVK